MSQRPGHVVESEQQFEAEDEEVLEVFLNRGGPGIETLNQPAAEEQEVEREIDID